MTTIRRHAPWLARGTLMSTIRKAIADSQKTAFRIVEFNVLGNHIHALVEADATRELSRGMQGFSGRIALRVNRAVQRTGKLFATRFHARALTTPRDVRNTLRYVLNNRRHHDKATSFARDWIDDCSSAPWFDGWAVRLPPHPLAAQSPPTVRAHSWLLAVGWRKRGLLRPDESPA